MPSISAPSAVPSSSFTTQAPRVMGLPFASMRTGVEFPMFGRGLDGDPTLTTAYNANTSRVATTYSFTGRPFTAGAISALSSIANLAAGQAIGGPGTGVTSRIAAVIASSSQTTTQTSGSPTLTVTSTAGLVVGQEVVGTGIQTNAHIVSIVDGTTVNLNLGATSSRTGSTTFSSTVTLTTPLTTTSNLNTTFRASAGAMARSVDCPVATVSSINTAGTGLSVAYRSGVFTDFAAGDLVLICNSIGDSVNYGNVGNFELAIVASSTSSGLTLTQPLQKSYGGAPPGLPGINTNFQFTGSLTAGSPTLTITSSTTNIAVGTPVTGSGIPVNTHVAAVVNATTFTLSQNATATNSGITVTFIGLTGTSVVQVIRVAEYNNVTINAGGSLTASGWNGIWGGILPFTAQSLTCTGGGSVNMSGLGYRAVTNPMTGLGNAWGLPGEGNQNLATGRGTTAVGSGGGGGGAGGNGAAGTPGSPNPTGTNGSGGGGGGGGGGGAGGGGGYGASGGTGSGGGYGGGASSGRDPSGSGAWPPSTPGDYQTGLPGKTGTTYSGGGGSGGSGGGGGASPGSSVGQATITQLYFGGAGGNAGAGGNGGAGGNAPSAPAPIPGLPGSGGGAGGGYQAGTQGANGSASPATTAPAYTAGTVNSVPANISSGAGGNGGGIIFASIAKVTTGSFVANGVAGTAGAQGNPANPSWQVASGSITPATTNYAGSGGGGGIGGGGGGGAGGTIYVLAQTWDPASTLSATGGAGGGPSPNGGGGSPGTNTPGSSNFNAGAYGYYDANAGPSNNYGIAGSGAGGRVKVAFFTTLTGSAAPSSGTDGPSPTYTPGGTIPGTGFKQTL